MLFDHGLVCHGQLTIAGVAFFTVPRAWCGRPGGTRGLVVEDAVFEGARQDVEAGLAQVILSRERYAGEVIKCQRTLVDLSKVPGIERRGSLHMADHFSQLFLMPCRQLGVAEDVSPVGMVDRIVPLLKYL
ncbi:hypothetical protein D9M71_743690 [compost metagenome]